MPELDNESHESLKALTIEQRRQVVRKSTAGLDQSLLDLAKKGKVRRIIVLTFVTFTQ